MAAAGAEAKKLMSGRVYCTYFDHNYLARGLALYQSLRAHEADVRLWVLCLSDACLDTLTQLNLPNLIPVGLAVFEAADPEVAATKSTRKTIEYFFTCTAAWMVYVSSRESKSEWVTYLDGDMFFFSSPDPIYEELGSSSVAIIPHRFAHKVRRLEKFGTYNVGWVGARNDEAGAEILAWWRARCIEWCYDYVDGSRFADQKYLEEFPRLSAAVRSIDHPGANLAPWNIDNYQITFDGEHVRIDDKYDLIFFHFQGVRKAFNNFYFDSHRLYRAPFTKTIRDHIYKPYVEVMFSMERLVSGYTDKTPKSHKRSSAPNIMIALKDEAQRLAVTFFQVVSIVTRRAIRIDEKM